MISASLNNEFVINSKNICNVSSSKIGPDQLIKHILQIINDIYLT